MKCLMNLIRDKINKKFSLLKVGLRLIIPDLDMIRDPFRICSENKICGIPESESDSKISDSLKMNSNLDILIFMSGYLDPYF